MQAKHLIFVVFLTAVTTTLGTAICTDDPELALAFMRYSCQRLSPPLPPSFLQICSTLETDPPSKTPTSSPSASPTSKPTAVPTSNPTTSPSNSSCEDRCIADPTLTQKQLNPSISWTCGFLNIECSDNEDATVIFTRYYLLKRDDPGQGDRACCFGDSDGISNCRATPEKCDSSLTVSPPPTATPQTSQPTSSKPTSSPTTCEPSCIANENLTQEQLNPSISWTCGFLNIECSDNEDASLIFTQYYLLKREDPGQGDRACCFGDSDGVSNCRATPKNCNVDVDDGSVPPPPPPSANPDSTPTSDIDDRSPPPPPSPPPTNPDSAPTSAVIVRKGQTVTLNSSESPESITILSGGTLNVNSNTNVITNSITVDSGGTLNVGTAANPVTNVNIYLSNPPCDTSGISQSDTAAVRSNSCLQNGQLTSHGRTNIFGTYVRPWTLLRSNALADDNQITVESCEGWRAGGELVVAGGFRQDQSTKHTIRNIDTLSSPSSCTITLTNPLSQDANNYDGFETGSIVQLEILYLTRNVVITGPPNTAQRQGIVISQRRIGVLKIHNTQVTNCGRIFLGEYCVHFHLLNACPECEIKGNSVSDGWNKGITVHGTSSSLVQDNVVFDIKGVGIYVENGREFDNNFLTNVVGCSKVNDCILNGAEGIGSSFGDKTRQAGMYFKSWNNNVIGNRVFGSLVCLLYEQSNVRTPCTVFLPYGITDGNVFHCKQFGWYPTSSFPRDVKQDVTGLVQDTSTCAPYNVNTNEYNGVEAIIDNHTEYGTSDFGVGSYELSDIRFRNMRIEGRTALYFKTYWRGADTGAFCDGCELISNPGVGLNLPGGDAMMEFKDTKLPNTKLSLPHHGYVNGGLLASQYVFSGDTSGVDLKAFDTEGENIVAIIVTVGDTNHILRQSRVAFSNFASLGCSNQFQDDQVLTCGAEAGKMRPLKLYGSGPNPISVSVKNIDGSESTHIFEFYNKASSNMLLFTNGDLPIYGGFAFVVRAGATITITSPDDISAIDFGHTGWHLLNDVVSITLNVIAANTQVSNCVLRTDHARPSMTPFGPLTTIDTNTLCSS
ncbi:hypothetical protein TrVE_jg13034 [Triparma verrucosa]|uniref:G8 domain-containing protein n=1 Tax=Triparma verrucosa TaxID=1606542 RepID=A0A9W7C337_9STRA|nr:hypothetical protein TrVE_jg13034 [Triparma verrucosa]